MWDGIKYAEPVLQYKFYGLSKIHKQGIPLRHTVSSRVQSLMEYWGVGKHLHAIGRSLTYHIKNTKHFVEHKSIKSG